MKIQLKETASGTKVVLKTDSGALIGSAYCHNGNALSAYKNPKDLDVIHICGFNSHEEAKSELINEVLMNC